MVKSKNLLTALLCLTHLGQGSTTCSCCAQKKLTTFRSIKAKREKRKRVGDKTTTEKYL